MSNNRLLRRKAKANSRKKNKPALTPKIPKQVSDPVKNLEFLEKVQAAAPIDLHLSTMFSGTQIGSLQFLPLYNKCMEVTSTSAPGWKVFRRAQRALTLAQYFDYALSIPGKKAECGVFRGFSALLTNLIAKMHNPDWTGKDYYLIDSFEGLSQPTVKDAIGFANDHNGRQTPLISHKAGAFATPIEQVKENLKDFPELSIQKGWIPEIFKNLPEEKWSFVHIDVDLFKPTYDALEYFFPRLAPGGVIINDDYSSPLFPGGGGAWIEFFDRIQKPFIVLDSGQAIFLNKE